MSEKKDPITVEAEIEIVSPLGTECIRTFSKAWRRTLDLPTPACARFTQWVRIEDKTRAGVVEDRK